MKYLQLVKDLNFFVSLTNIIACTNIAFNFKKLFYMPRNCTNLKS